MEINRNNYQIFFLDYFENALEPGQVADLMVFLETNPDLNAEFESFDPIMIEPDAIKYEGKQELKRRNYTSTTNINALNYEKWMVAGLEKDLSEIETNELESFMEHNPEARLEYAFFMKSRLIPENVNYREKLQLKKKGLFVLYRTELSLGLAIAASILIFFGLFFGLGDKKQNREVSAEVVFQQLNSMDWSIVDHRTVKFIPLRSDHSGTFLENEIFEFGNLYSSRTALSLLPELIPVKAGNIQISNEKINENTILAIEYRSYSVEGTEIGPDKNRPSFAMRFLGGAIKNVFGERNNSTRSLLEYTVDGYNLMTDREVEVEKQYDASGNIVAYQVNGEIIKIGRKVNLPLDE